MKKIIFVFMLTTILTLAAFASEKAINFPKIDRKPKLSNWRRGALAALPKYDPAKKRNPFQVDLRSYDLSKLDLAGSQADLLFANFDDKTTWPDPERMPDEFDYKQIMELGKNPGLSIRSLHKKGITGRGIGIAILDQPMIVDHLEYGERLRLYEEINIRKGMEAQMHGPAVTSIAVGKTVGVAPEADLYYIAQFNADFEKGKTIWNFEYLAKGVLRILEINEQLPKGQKIRVISMSVGWHPSQKGYKAITEAVQKAKTAGMLIICSSVEQVHGFKFHGLGRNSSANPDDSNSYEPGLWWVDRFYGGMPVSDRLLVPMDSRTTASPTGSDDYVFYRFGGWSWSIPYIAGVYALSAQVEPEITPDRFWALAMKTGRTIELDNNGKIIPFGPILDPAKLIDAVNAGELSDDKAVAAELEKYKKTVASKPVEADFQRNLTANVAKLDINTATKEDVIEIFGEPLSYNWNKQTFKKENLPEIYLMRYPGDFLVFIAKHRVMELRFEKPGPYRFRDTITVGSTLEEVLQVLGPPVKTVEGQEIGRENGVLYKDINGREGWCYYLRRDQGVRMFFGNYRVAAIYLTRTEP
ncbi:MAG: S8 family serine peptidase [Planctomycetota bacterium]